MFGLDYIETEADLVVVRNGLQPIVIDTKQLEKEVFPIVFRLSPGNLRTERNVAALNKISLGDGIDPVRLDKKNNRLYSSKKTDDIID